MLFRFGDFQVDSQRYQLSRTGRVQRLERIPVELLLLLVENPGNLITRETIVERLWGKDVFLETDHSINTAINKVRAALRENLTKPRFIQTVKGKGYRFIADVEVCRNDPSETEPAKLEEETPRPDFDSLTTSFSNHASPAREPTEANDELSSDEPPQAPAELVESSSPATAEGHRKVPSIKWALVTCTIIGVIGIAMSLRKPSGGQAGSTSKSTAEIHSLAVLPFANLSEYPEREYFVDGMTDQLISDLAQATSLRVISRTSVMQYKGVKKSLPEIAAALNVDAIVEGSVQYSASRVRITAQLLDARNDRHLWARTYDRDQGELLNIQTEVTRDISNEISAEFGVHGAALANKKHSPVPEAYENYLQGRYFWNKRDLENLQKAIGYFDRAIQIDPQYALAYSGLAEAYGAAANVDSWGRARTAANAEQAAHKAIELDSSLAPPHVVLASLASNMQFDWTGAEREFRRAISLDPGYSTAHQRYSDFLSLMGRHEEAILEAQRALDLDPLSLFTNSQLGWAYYYARRYDEAIAQLDKALALDANFAPARHRLAAAYEMKGMHSAAITQLQEMGGHLGENGAYLALLGYSYARAGNAASAQKTLAQIKVLPSPQFGNADLALIYTGTGDKEKAFGSLQRARAAREIVGVRIDPLFSPLQSDPRFQDLFRGMNFPGVEK